MCLPKPKKKKKKKESRFALHTQLSDNSKWKEGTRGTVCHLTVSPHVNLYRGSPGPLSQPRLWVCSYVAVLGCPEPLPTLPMRRGLSAVVLGFSGWEEQNVWRKVDILMINPVVRTDEAACPCWSAQLLFSYSVFSDTVFCKWTICVVPSCVSGLKDCWCVDALCILGMGCWDW